jgi:hypothetical protein
MSMRAKLGERELEPRTIYVLENLIEMFKESHQAEIDDNHGGDGQHGCSYCEAIAQAERCLKRLQDEADNG